MYNSTVKPTPGVRLDTSTIGIPVPLVLNFCMPTCTISVESRLMLLKVMVTEEFPSRAEGSVIDMTPCLDAVVMEGGTKRLGIAAGRSF